MSETRMRQDRASLHATLRELAADNAYLHKLITGQIDARPFLLDSRAFSQVNSLRLQARQAPGCVSACL